MEEVWQFIMGADQWIVHYMKYFPHYITWSAVVLSIPVVVGVQYSSLCHIFSTGPLESRVAGEPWATTLFLKDKIVPYERLDL